MKSSLFTMSSAPQSIAVKFETILQTVWIGGLWVIGYVVTPILFASLDERRLAGELAGHMFSAIAYIGLCCGTVLLVLALLKAGTWLKDLRVLALVIMLISVAVSVFVIQPMMQDLKFAGIVPDSAAAVEFGRLHGVSSVLYLVTSVLGLFLLVYRR